MIMEDLQKINNVKVIPAALPYEINNIDADKKLVKWKSQKKDSQDFGEDGKIFITTINFSFIFS